MRKVGAKVITVFSQLLVASAFLFLLFSNEKTNNESIVIKNNNLDKMADKTIFLFNDKVKEEDSSIIVELDSLKEEAKVEEVIAEEKVVEEVKETKEEPIIKEEIKVTSLEPDIDSFTSLETFAGYNLTGYGPDCYGCSGRTSTGHDLNSSIYYEDADYGKIRIVAADKSIPFYSVMRISNVPGMDSFLAIVLDRGGNVGYGKGTFVDLAFETEKDPNILGLTKNVTFDIIRRGK